MRLGSEPSTTQRSLLWRCYADALCSALPRNLPTTLTRLTLTVRRRLVVGIGSPRDIGWDGRIRTCGGHINSVLPCRLATSQCGAARLPPPLPEGIGVKGSSVSARDTGTAR